MSNYTLTRDQILNQLLRAVQDQPDLLACWEAGSTATGRKDEWSDIDFMLLVKDGSTKAVGAQVEEALLALAPIDLKLEIPQPAWHGHWQTLFHLAGCPMELQIDLCIMEESKPNRFLEPEMHGKPLVYVDRGGYTQVGPTDPAPIAAQIAKRISFTRDRVALLGAFVAKELRRERLTDAISMYQGLLLQPVVELLRIAHDPWRWNFGMRYLRFVLPEERLRQVEQLSYVGGPEELFQKAAEAQELVATLVRELEGKDWVAHLEAHR